jgi:hypothetical protein
MRHIKTAVTLPPEKAEKIYIAAEALEELAELLDAAAGGDEAKVPENLLRILGKELTEGISDVSFPFED